MPAQLLGRDSGDRHGNFLLQFLEKRVHDGHLAFLDLSVRMLRDHKIHPRYHRKDAHEDGQLRAQAADRELSGNTGNRFVS